jgi:2-polyprenyl-3-methyl-5-hydroxy-6-metoxy-1,4-benzoquinol methylase
MSGAQTRSMVKPREPLPWGRHRPQLVPRLWRLSFAQLPRAESPRYGKSMRKLRLRHPKRVVSAERSPGWYDRKFSRTSTYQVAYQDSPYYFLWSVIVDRLRRDGAGRVLEIGCGTGQLAAFLLEHGIESYVGMDFSPKAIEYARKAAPKGRFVVDDARTSRIYVDERHDVLICTEVLEHIADDLSVVQRFRPRTRCLFSVPSYDSESHVRFFRDAAAVRERYASYFSTLGIAGFRVPGTASGGISRIFLADGERNDFDSRLDPA